MYPPLENSTTRNTIIKKTDTPNETPNLSRSDTKPDEASDCDSDNARFSTVPTSKYKPPKLDPTMTLSPGLSSTQLDKTFNVRDLVQRLKDLKCKVCSKTFITKEHLVAHMKIHDMEKEKVNEKQVDLSKEPEDGLPVEKEVGSSKGQ